MKNSSKWALLQALWSDGVHHPLPAFITLDVTPRCNLTCIGCRFHSPILKHHHTGRETTTDMPLALVQRLLQDRAALSSTQIFVEGSGEPFMHPHIIEMLTLLKKAQFKLTIFTNGTLLDSELVKKLIEIKVDILRISLFAASASAFEQNYAGTDLKQFQRILANMQRLDELRRESGAVKPLMHLFFAVNRNNMHELASAMELAERTGCDGITYGRFVELGDEVAGLVLVKSERMQLARQLRTLAKELNRRSLTNTIKRDVVMQESGPETWRLAPCMIGWFHARIRGNGDVVPCCRCSYPLGNLYEKTFSEIWQGDRMMEFRRRVAAPDGMGWLKSQNAQCHDCPHIPEMIKLYRIQRMLKWTQRRRETATG